MVFSLDSTRTRLGFKLLFTLVLQYYYCCHYYVVVTSCVCCRYGFKGPPNLSLVAKPRLGNHEVKLSRVTHWIERKLQELVNVSTLFSKP